MFDTFIKIDGIDGESQDDKHKNWIEVSSFSHDMRQPPSASVSSLGGGTTGRVDMEDFQFTKGIDKSSPKLYEACCKGAGIANASVEFCRAGGDKLVYLKIDMAGVVVSRVAASGSGKDLSDFPSELVTLNFSKITWTYTQQNRQGQAAGQVQTSWNMQTGKAG
jgi:type VI secretion system secreted protein Hcp